MQKRDTPRAIAPCKAPLLSLLQQPLATESSHNRTRGRDLTERNFAIAKLRQADSEHGPFSADFAQNRNCFFLNGPNFAKFQGIEPPMLVDFCPFRPHSGGLSRPSGTPGPARAPGRSGAVPARPGTSPVATWVAPEVGQRRLEKSPECGCD